VFFVLAKVLWFVVQPSTLALGAVIAGAALSATAWRRLSRWMLWGGIAAMLVLGLSPIGDAMVRPLEARFAHADIDKAGAPIAGIIVLGGAEDSRAGETGEVAGLNEAAERYTEAVALARRLPNARLVFTGGSATLIRSGPVEADTAMRLFLALGIPKERITLENQSRDTHENAVFTARLVAPKPGERWLLVTSAWHMPRAVGCFRKAGFAVEAWPVDYRAPQRLDPTLWHTSIPDGLRRIDWATREYIGLVAYYLAGRTDALLPRP
jgi:uncharacterized SAM-binding protein YcdF (DUF218 family)